MNQITSVLMKCGCRANAVCSGRGGKRYNPPIPSCAIHDCIEPADLTPDLTGRVAKCGDHASKPSSLDLAFFEYCGPGSREATEICVCGYNTVAHKKHDGHCPRQAKRKPASGMFEARGPREFDRYYCGCRGWD